MSLSIFFSLSHEDISFLPPQCLSQRGGITVSIISPKLFNFITFTDTPELQVMAYLHVFLEFVSLRPQVTQKPPKVHKTSFASHGG